MCIILILNIIGVLPKPMLANQIGLMFLHQVSTTTDTDKSFFLWAYEVKTAIFAISYTYKHSFCFSNIKPIHFPYTHCFSMRFNSYKINLHMEFYFQGSINPVYKKKLCSKWHTTIQVAKCTASHWKVGFKAICLSSTLFPWVSAFLTINLY